MFRDLRALPVPTKPFFDGSTPNTIYFEKKEYHQIVQTMMNDYLSNYQSKFNIFAEMTLTKLGKFKTHYEEVDVVLQKYVPCTWNPMGGMSESVDEVSPCPAMINMENCPQDIMNSCFEGLAEWRANGTIDSSDLDNRMVRLVSTIGKGTAMAIMDWLTVGMLYSGFDNVVVNPQLDATKAAAFNYMNTVCYGFLAKLLKIGNDNGLNNLQLHSVLDEMYDGQGRFVGSFRNIFDEMMIDATPELNIAINMGGVVQGNLGSRPICLVDYQTFAGVRKEYQAQCSDQNCKPHEARLTKETEGQQEYYYIDGIPIIPLMSTYNADNKYTMGHTHFVLITMSEIIQLGSSTDLMDKGSVDGFERTLTVYKDPNPTVNKVFIDGHYLLGTGIASPLHVALAIQHFAKV